MIATYFKTAWKNLFKHRLNSIINIVGLSVGMASAVLIWMWVQNELNFDTDHKDAKRIFRVTTSIKEQNWKWETSPLLLAEAAKEKLPEIESITRLRADQWPIFNINGQPVYEKNCAYVDNNWFDIFKYQFLEGNISSFRQSSNGIVLSASAAKKYFGDEPALGRVIKVNDTYFEIKAIVKDAPANSSFQYEAFMPLSALLADKATRENDENWDNFNYLTFVKLKATAQPAQTAQKLTKLLPLNSGTTINLISLKEMHFENDLQVSVFNHGNWATIYIFAILAFVLLLVACINYVNLTTAKASLRAKEVGVRKVIGASRIDLFWQFMAESIVISAVSLLLTLLIIQLILPYFNLLTGKHFESIFGFSSTWMIIFTTLFASFVLNSIYPAIVLSSFKPLAVFRGYTLLKIKDTHFRKVLVVVQFTVSVVLIVAAIIIYRQMQFIRQTNPGYNRDQVLTLPIPLEFNDVQKASFIAKLKQQLLLQHSILSMSGANQSIENIGSLSSGSADWQGREAQFKPKIAQLSTDADFQKTMQLQMLDGRWFEQDKELDKNNVVLNEAAIAELNIPQPAIGQRFTFKGRTGQIIGIVKNFNYRSLHDKTGPLIAFNDPQWFHYIMVRIAPNHTQQGLAAVEQAWKNIAPGHPFEYHFLDEAFHQLYKADQQISSLILVFALIAILLSAMGLFGLAAFAAEQRTKEIGIRKILGASLLNLTALFSKEFAKLVGLAVLIATPFSFWIMSKWIQNFAYRIDIDWWIFISAGLIALVIALLTTSLQAIRTALANPVKSLRNE